MYLAACLSTTSPSVVATLVISHPAVPRAAGREVAVKVFKGEASPDGRAADEIEVTCAVSHPNLIQVTGLVQQPHALVVLKVTQLGLVSQAAATAL